MYKNNFVVAVKHNGKVLREKNGEVMLPFGSEYSVLLKNLDSRKAVASVSIDGEDVLNGRRLIVEPNSSLELERFLEDMDRGRRFKFVKKTKDIVKHRGDRVDDGVLRVEFWFEKQKVEREEVVRTRYEYEPYYPWYPWPVYRYPWPIYIYDSTTPISTSTSGSVQNSTANVYCSFSGEGGTLCSDPSQGAQSTIVPDLNEDEGITVKGGISYQQFRHGYTDKLEEQSSVITLRLKGTKADNKRVEVPITVKDKIKCSGCGKSCSSKDSYCSRCGAYLRE